MITRSDSFEPEWVRTAAARMVWRRDLIINLAGAVGLSSTFIADAVDITDRQVRNILNSEAASDPLILAIRELVGRNAPPGPPAFPGNRSR